MDNSETNNNTLPLRITPRNAIEVSELECVALLSSLSLPAGDYIERVDEETFLRVRLEDSGEVSLIESPLGGSIEFFATDEDTFNDVEAITFALDVGAHPPCYWREHVAELEAFDASGHPGEREDVRRSLVLRSSDSRELAAEVEEASSSGWYVVEDVAEATVIIGFVDDSRCINWKCGLPLRVLDESELDARVIAYATRAERARWRARILRDVAGVDSITFED